MVAESTLGWAYTNLGAPHCGKWARLWVATDLPIYTSWFSVPCLFMEVNPLLCIVDLHHVIKHCTCAASALSEVGYTRKQMFVFRPHQCKALDTYIIWISTFKSEYDIYIYIFEGSLEVKLPTIWTDEKQSREEAERRERLEERRVEEKE